MDIIIESFKRLYKNGQINDNTLNGLLTKGTITTSPKKPYTTDGIPANNCTAGFIILYNHLGQNFDINTAVKIPIGTPIIIAPIVT